MTTVNHTHETEYNVPVELIADVLRALIKSKIPYRITGVKSRTNVIVLSVKYTSEYHHTKTKENIETLLDDFDHYMSGLGDSVLYSNDHAQY